MKQQLRELKSATMLVALLGGGVFLYLVDELVAGSLDAYNHYIFDGVQTLGAAQPWLLNLAVFVTRTGDWLGYLLAALLVRHVYRRSGNGLELRCLLLVLLGAPVLVNILKLGYALPRPLIDGLPTTTGYAFPSGHTLFATCLYGYLGTRLLAAGRWWGWLVVLWPVAVAWSRVMLSRHWFSDVVGGALVGSAWVAFCIHLRDRKPYD